MWQAYRETAEQNVTVTASLRKIIVVLLSYKTEIVSTI
jgi:hypothetical protein